MVGGREFPCSRHFACIWVVHKYEDVVLVHDVPVMGAEVFEVDSINQLICRLVVGTAARSGDVDDERVLVVRRV